MVSPWKEGGGILFGGSPLLIWGIASNSALEGTLRQRGYRPSARLDPVETAHPFARFEGQRLGRYWPFFHSVWPVSTFATMVFVKIICIRSKAPRRKRPAVGLPTSVSNNKNQEL